MLRPAIAFGMLSAVVAASPAFAQMCPDGTPPPCRAAPARAAPPPAPGSKLRPYTIVAEFDGTAPAEMRAAAKNLVTSALDESNVVAALPRDQIRLGLALAGKPDTTRLDVATARELAVRGSVRTVLTGTLDQVGRTYSVAVRLVDADSDRVVAIRRDIARGDDDLIPVLDRVVRAVRTSLGERRPAIAANRRRWVAGTPSLAAYQEWRRGMELNQGAMDFRGALAAFKRALALDTGFAAAWLGLRAAYGNLGFEDSSRHALAEALARKDRLTQRQRLEAEAIRVCHREDRWECLAAFEEANRASGGPLPNFVGLLMGLGRDSEAVAIFEDWQRSAPFGLLPTARGALAAGLLPLGRVEEARRLAETLSGDFGTWTRMVVAAWTADWPAADSLARSLLERTRLPRWRMQALQTRAWVAAARGRVREAMGFLGQCDCGYERFMLSVVSGLPVTGPQVGAAPPDTTVGRQLLAAMTAAAAGDTVTAIRYLARYRALPAEQRHAMGLLGELPEAWFALAAGRPADAVSRLRLLVDVRASGGPFYSQPAQWLLAGEYERLGQLDSAATQLERLATWRGSRGSTELQRGLTHSFAHQRLVLLYARLGRLADAQRHWQVFSTTFTQPDPEMQHFVDEARAALAAAGQTN